MERILVAPQRIRCAYDITLPFHARTPESFYYKQEPDGQWFAEGLIGMDSDGVVAIRWRHRGFRYRRQRLMGELDPYSQSNVRMVIP